MKELSGFTREIATLTGLGKIKYSLWLDNDGKLHVKITDNLNSGTYSDILFSVLKYASLRKSDEKLGHLEGFDLCSNKIIIRKDNNNGAFLKAILCDLLPDELEP